MTCCVPLKGYTYHRSRTPALNKTCKVTLKCYIGSTQNKFSKGDTKQKQEMLEKTKFEVGKNSS